MIGDGDAGKLFHMQTNLRFGCVILRHYLERERGDLFMALGATTAAAAKTNTPAWCWVRKSSGCLMRMHRAQSEVPAARAAGLGGSAIHNVSV